MSEIKPEHVSDEFLIDPNQPCEHRESIACVLNVAQQYGFTVLMPGELCWIQSNLGHSPNYREWRAVGASYEMQINDSILHEGTYNTVSTQIKNGYESAYYSHPTLEAAKQFCQQLEDKARST